MYNKRNHELLISDSIVGDGEKLYYVAKEFATIFEIDIQDGTTKYLFTIREYIFNGQFRSVAKLDNRIFVFSSFVKKYVVYDMDMDDYQIYDIPQDMLNESDFNWAPNYTRSENILYFHFQSPVIVTYDMKNDKWNAFRKIEAMSKYNLQHWFVSDAYEYNNELIFGLAHTNCLLFCSKDFSYINEKRIDLSKEIDDIESFVGEDDYLYLFCVKEGYGYVIKISLDDYGYKIISTIKVDSVNAYAGGMKILGDDIWLFPTLGERAFRVNKETGKTKEISDIPLEKRESFSTDWDEMINYYGGVMREGHYFAIHPYSGCLVDVDYINNHINIDNIVFKDEEINRMCKEIMSDRPMVKETAVFDLKMLCSTM